MASLIRISDALPPRPAEAVRRLADGVEVSSIRMPRLGLPESRPCTAGVPPLRSLAPRDVGGRVTAAEVADEPLPRAFVELVTPRRGTAPPPVPHVPPPVGPIQTSEIASLAAARLLREAALGAAPLLPLVIVEAS